MLFLLREGCGFGLGNLASIYSHPTYVLVPVANYRSPTYSYCVKLWNHASGISAAFLVPVYVEADVVVSERNALFVEVGFIGSTEQVSLNGFIFLTLATDVAEIATNANVV